MTKRLLTGLFMCQIALVVLSSCSTTEGLKDGEIATPTTVKLLVSDDSLVGRHVSIAKCIYLPEKSFYAIKAGHVGAAIYGGYDKMVLVIKDSTEATNYAELVLSEAQYQEFRTLDPRTGDFFQISNVLVKKIVGDEVALIPLRQFSIGKANE